jgi:hypothetical protein
MIARKVASNQVGSGRAGSLRHPTLAGQAHSRAARLPPAAARRVGPRAKGPVPPLPPGSQLRARVSRDVTEPLGGGPSDASTNKSSVYA